jgi:nucleoside-diphosphate-sugar epimerase
MAKKLFLIGPGYIGRTIIDELSKDEYDITALVRRQEAADELAKINVHSVFGTLDDGDVISRQTAASDIVIHAATADDMSSVKAVIKGIRQRAGEGKKTIYIHTSGASFLSDESKGQYKSDTIYHDNKPEELDALPDSASHRLIDLEIINARKELGAEAKIFIILPPLIFGAVKHLGRLSIQVPTMSRFALKHKYAGYVGGGKAVWSTVHVADLARAYVLILHWAEQAPDKVSLENPYFFCENGEEISWSEIADMIAENLQPLGKVDDAKSKVVPEADYGDLFGPYSTVVIGANSRSRAQRVREMGWNPREKTIREAFKTEELPLVLEEKGEFRGYDKPAASGATG